VAEAVSVSVPEETPGRGTRGLGVIKGSLLSMLAIAALGITRLVHSVLIGRNTDEATVAQVGVMISATMLAGLFLPGGIASAASKFIPYHLGRGNPAAARATYRMLTMAGYTISALLAIIVTAGLHLYGASWPDAASAGLLSLAFSLYSIEKSALYGFDRVGPYVRLELTGSVVAIAATVIVVVAGWHAYLLPLTLGYAVLILGAWYLLRRPTTLNSTFPSLADSPVTPNSPASAGSPVLGGSVSRGGSLAASPAGAGEIGRAGGRWGWVGLVSPEQRREMAGYVGLASVGGLASAGLLQALPIVAEIYTTTTEVAYFFFAINLVAPLYFLPRALSMALFPAMAHAHGAADLETVKRHADLTTRALFVLLAPFFAVGMVLARPILKLLYGDNVAAGAPVLQVLLIGTFYMVTQVGAVNALSSGSRRDVRIPVGSAVAGFLAAMIVAVPLGMLLGGTGIGVSYVLAAVVSAAWPLTVIARRFSLAWLGPVLRAALAIVAGLAIAWLSYRVSPSALMTITAALAAAAVAVALLYRDIRSVLAKR
jgi:O-antigen/teichoic acid export membrane protein